jgi:hypothetical protein
VATSKLPQLHLAQASLGMQEPERWFRHRCPVEILQAREGIASVRPRSRVHPRPLLVASTAVGCNAVLCGLAGIMKLNAYRWTFVLFFGRGI